MAHTDVTTLHKLAGNDLAELSEAADAAILDGGGFGWLTPPLRDVMESYWRGVMLVPERTLIVGRLDGVIAGSVQLSRPPRNNEARAHAGIVSSFFVAPWSRGHGLANGLLEACEELARREGYTVVNLDVRETQDRAIQIFQARDYRRLGIDPKYARVGGHYVAGVFYQKDL